MKIWVKDRVTQALINLRSYSMVFSSYIPDSEEKSLPAIILLRVQDVTLWVYLDIGSDRSFYIQRRN